jgi:putative phosphoribosyl transferase
MLFLDRVDAGRRLAGGVRHLKGSDVVVLGLPRGGVPVAFEVACALGAPLDVLVVRKLGVPFQPELAMGAIGEGGVRLVNDAIVRAANVTEEEITAAEARERTELSRRIRAYRGDRPAISLQGRTAVVVDDGIATGATIRVACQVARSLGAARVVVAVPVASPHAVVMVEKDADEVVCLHAPSQFYAIGQFYRDFTQTPDREVVDLLRQAATSDSTDPSTSASAEPVADPPVGEEVQVLAGTVRLAGHLTVPEGAGGVVIFAHGSGSSRHSPRNRYVAAVLNRAGLGTLLFDLLTPGEEVDRSNVFDIALLGERLVQATRWLRSQPLASPAQLGYFGASTGAAAALWAAAEQDIDVRAVVSRGGRPDLAMQKLGSVRAPTLLIVGGADAVVLDLNRKAHALLRCEKRLAVVPGATHLFEEPGALDAVADEACDWFVSHMIAPAVHLGHAR